MSARVCGGQKWVLDLLKLELKVNSRIWANIILPKEQYVLLSFELCSKSVLYLTFTLIHHTFLSLVISLTNVCLYSTLSLVFCPLTSIEAQGATATNWLLWQLHRDDIKHLLLLSQFISYLGNSIDLTPGTKSFCSWELFCELHTYSTHPIPT